MVIDFELDLFVGTAMMQIKNILLHPRLLDDTTDVDNDRTGSYFRDKKHILQGIVWGRFKRPGVPMLECVTGQAFHRPLRCLPPWFVVRAALSIICGLVPKLQASLDCGQLRFLSPLLSTAQTALSHWRCLK
jgi:hypothetical protein